MSANFDNNFNLPVPESSDRNLIKIHDNNYKSVKQSQDLLNGLNQSQNNTYNQPQSAKIPKIESST